MQCPRCHAENREDRRFCGESGLSLAFACPSCGFVNEGSEKFCGRCGALTVGATAAPDGRFGPLIERHLTDPRIGRNYQFPCRISFASPSIAGRPGTRTPTTGASGRGPNISDVDGNRSIWQISTYIKQTDRGGSGAAGRAPWILRSRVLDNSDLTCPLL